MEKERSKESQCPHQAGAYAGFLEETLKSRRIKSQEDAPVWAQGHATSQTDLRESTEIKSGLNVQTNTQHYTCQLFLSLVRAIFTLS